MRVRSKCPCATRNKLCAYATIKLTNDDGTHSLRICTSVTMFDCSGNRLNTIRGLEVLTSLQRLYCNGNRLTTLEGLGALTSLQRLYCHINRLTTLEGLGALASLEQLCCSTNNLTTLEGLGALTTLQVLYCRNNPGLLTIPPLTRHHLLRAVNTRGTGLSVDIHGVWGSADECARFRTHTGLIYQAACARAAAIGVLGVARHIRRYRDVLGLISRAVWKTRRDKRWLLRPEAKRQKKRMKC